MAKRKAQKEYAGTWYINNSGGRQSVRNNNGQSVIMEAGDVIFVLDEEKSLRRVFKQLSHFMQFQGDLSGHHCIYPSEPGHNKLCQPAVFVKNLAGLAKLDLHEDLLTDLSVTNLLALKESQEAANKPAAV